MKTALVAAFASATLTLAVPVAADAATVHHAAHHVTPKASAAKQARAQVLNAAVALESYAADHEDYPHTQAKAAKAVAKAVKNGFKLVQYDYLAPTGSTPAGFTVCVGNTAGAWASYASPLGSVTASGASGTGCLDTAPPPSH